MTELELLKHWLKNDKANGISFLFTAKNPSKAFQRHVEKIKESNVKITVEYNSALTAGDLPELIYSFTK